MALGILELQSHPAVSICIFFLTSWYWKVVCLEEVWHSFMTLTLGKCFWRRLMREHRTWISPAAIPLCNMDIPPSSAPFERKAQVCSVVWTIMFFSSPKHFTCKELKEPFCFDFASASLEKALRGFLPHLLGLVIRKERDSCPWCESEPSLVSNLIPWLRLPLLVQKAQPLQRANCPVALSVAPGTPCLGAVSPWSLKDRSGKVTQIQPSLGECRGSHQAGTDYCSFFVPLRDFQKVNLKALWHPALGEAPEQWKPKK